MLHRLRRALPALVFSAVLIDASMACAASFTYKAINTNGSDLAEPRGINSSDQVVGVTKNSEGDSVGFVWSAGQLTLVDGSSSFWAINDSGIAVGPGGTSYYVSYDVGSGVLTDVPVGLPLHGKYVYYATGINATGEVVGLADGDDGRSGKFVGFMTVGGQTSELLPPHQKVSQPVALNGKGDVVVDYRGSLTQYPSYLYKKGKFLNIAVPGASTTTASFITDRDIIGGSFATAESTSGFLFSDGNYTTYSPSGATSSTVTGVGPSGQVYGTFTDASGIPHGFVNVGGTYYQIDVPKSTYTYILGVGTSGSIIGFYGTSQGGEYGYIGKCRKKDVCTQ